MKKYILFIVIFLTATLYAMPSIAENEKKSVHEVEEVDKAPYLLKRVKAFYPTYLRDAQGVLYEGMVEIRFVVTKEGRVKNPVVTKSIPKNVFDKYALEAIKKYRYSPAQKNNKPVDCYTSYVMEFNLVGDEEIITGYDYYKASNKGFKNLEDGEYDKAIEAFNEAIAIYRKVSRKNADPGRRFSRSPGSSYTGRGIAYMSLKKYEEALSDFTRAIDIDPETGLTYKFRGQLNHVTGNLQKALEDYSNALEKSPELEDIYFERGDVLRKLGRHSEAIEDYTREININESNVQAYNNRAVSYSILKDMDNMCSDLKRACQLDDCRGLDLAKTAGKCTDNIEITEQEIYTQKGE